MSVKGGPNIVTSGMLLEFDAANTKSYPGSGATWFDKSGFANNGTLINGPTFNNCALPLSSKVISLLLKFLLFIFNFFQFLLEDLDT